MNPLSKWIWPDADIQNDQYAEFHDSFTFSGQWAVLEISADSNYAVYLNGLQQNITSQLGFGYWYDLTREDGWMEGCLNGFLPSRIDHRQTQLVNALAILCGAAQGSIAQQIAEKLAQGSYMPETLSMLCFTYDALLMVDLEKYKDHILTDIDRRYKQMLDAGATSFWETEKGDQDFDLAGSLSHGWSAMPIYYYSTLN